jgi:hypothetical protein
MSNLIGNLMILGMLNLSITSPFISRPDAFLGKLTDIAICSVECACITKGNRSIGDSIATVISLPFGHINFASNKEQFTSDFELSITASNRAKGWLIRQFSKLTCGFARLGQRAYNPIGVDNAAIALSIKDHTSKPDIDSAPLHISYRTGVWIAMLCSLSQSISIWIYVIIRRLRG